MGRRQLAWILCGGTIVVTLIVASMLVPPQLPTQYLSSSKQHLQRVSPFSLPPSRPAWHKIPTVPCNQAAINGTKWIVVTTVNYPTLALKKLVKLSGWEMVVIGDTKTPKDWALKGAVFLDLKAQAALGYRIHDLIPLHHYARKNIGYLYAIQHGAKLIYETDDDNLLIVDDLSKAFALDDLPASMLRYASPQEGGPNRSTVNPYVHFGQPSMWPRGLPLEDIAHNSHEEFYVQDPLMRASIQQGLAEGDPDVDAIFRLTRVSSGKLIRVKFDEKQPAVALPRGLLAPFNSQNTLFRRDALWGLLIPVSTTFRICDIWRGYWAQRLLWELGGRLSFFPASVLQERNVHNYMHDYQEEADMYTNASRLVGILKEWRAKESGHFFDQVVELSYKMALEGFWGFMEVELVTAWLTDLISVGYAAPVLETPAASESSKYIPTPMDSALVTVALEGSKLSEQAVATVSEPSSAREGKRYVLIFSLFERLGGAMSALSELLRLCHCFGLSLVEPNVYEAEIGALAGYTQKLRPYNVQPLSFYFNTTPIKTYHPRFTTLQTFSSDSGIDYSSEGIFIRVGLLGFITYEIQVADPNYSNGPPFSGVPGTVNCTQHWRTILTTKELHPVLLPSGRFGVAGYSFESIVCISPAGNLSEILPALLATQSLSPKSIAAFELRRTAIGPKDPARFGAHTLVSHAGGQLTPQLEDYKVNVLGGNVYAVVQFRGGSFFKTPDIKPADLTVGFFMRRAENLLECTRKLIRVVNETLAGNVKIHLASDFQTLPERFTNQTLNEIIKSTFSSALRELEGAFGERMTPLHLERLPSRLIDPVGVATIADLKVAVDAEAGFFSASVYFQGRGGSSYIGGILGARDRKGFPSQLVECRYP